MRDRVGDKVRLEHISDSAISAISIIENLPLDKFISDSVSRLAIERLFEIIGEAANHISEEFKQENPDIEWRKMIGLRNILIHEYFVVNPEILWNTTVNELPVLVSQISEALKSI